MTSEIKTVGIIGAGTMGSGIAQAIAQAGYAVRLYDINEDTLRQGLERVFASVRKAVEKGHAGAETLQTIKDCLTSAADLQQAAQADLIIETAPEDLALKQELFRQLDAVAPENAILASNTSSLPITALGAVTQRPALTAGLHFFNPASKMQLVEVIRGQKTAEKTIHDLVHFAKGLGKTPVVSKDAPGFIVNRIARPFYSEALRILGEGGVQEDEAGIRIVDTVMREAGGFKMGPFELMDLIGVDVNYAVTQSVYNYYFQEPRYRPHPIQARMVAAGLLGRKTGEGFYRYDT